MIRRSVKICAAIVAMLVLGWLIAQVATLAASSRTDDVERAALRADVEQSRAESQALAEQVRALGEEPVVEPDHTATPLQERFVPVPGPRGRDGVDGPRGPAGAPGADGKDGPAGADGEPGAPGAAGVAGEDGSDGQPGVDGKDGAAGPAGPPGESGATGPAGEPGRSITTVTCPDGDWIITYSDGTSDTVTGPCRLLPSP